ncbi:MAG TPA: S41 family peptidase [Candidatus Hydrogenedentes bacterium]|nr:S41 family peptidase [Candidatus Hydrogenedentota bacterium]HPG67097.1 S41 family peptidase [Candidatus Hydrogenedentota bacterium]
MHKKTTRSDFLALFGVLVVTVLVLTNGFAARVRAQGENVDVYTKLEPIGDVLDRILEEYYKAPDVDKVVEGALQGMLMSLDKHSSFISADALKELTEDTEGEFDGIGVTIRKDDDGHIVVFQPLPDSPAATAGVRAFDRILKIDGNDTEGMELHDAAKLIRGKRGTVVKLTVERGYKEDASEILDIDVIRGTIPLESVKEARLLDGGIGYIRVSDFKKSTSDEIGNRAKELLDQGMTSLVLDLRWNVGGLLSASKEVCELFLPKNTLVTYTQGREGKDGKSAENMRLYTEKQPIIPDGFPMILLVNEQTASSAEIVTGALQFWARAIIVGQTTYGKGSVQTIIPIKRPEGSALRLTTALYYTPAEVTIHNKGIMPDVEVVMDLKQQTALWEQMYKSYENAPEKVNEQNHGSVTGDETTEPDAEVVEDTQLQRAVEILKEDALFENLLKQYHKDPSETQIAATESENQQAEEGAASVSE